jgi:hypothetical protein
MLRDVDRTFPGDWSLEEVIEARRIMRDNARAELDREPEYAEILDYNGKVIWGMKRDRIVEVKARSRRPSLESFLEETSTAEDTLRELFEEATGELETAHREDAEVEELVSIARRLVEEFGVALGYVRAAGAVVHADMGHDLIVRARAALEPFGSLSIESPKKSS